MDQTNRFKATENKRMKIVVFFSKINANAKSYCPERFY